MLTKKKTLALLLFIKLNSLLGAAEKPNIKHRRAFSEPTKNNYELTPARALHAETKILLLQSFFDRDPIKQKAMYENWKKEFKNR